MSYHKIRIADMVDGSISAILIQMSYTDFYLPNMYEMQSV